MISQITDCIMQHVLTEKEIAIHFQPIVSLDKERAIGCEALMRASYLGESIDAESLFEYARNTGCEYELDRLCRNIAITEYMTMNQDVLLFLNFEAALLEQYLRDFDEYVLALQRLGCDKEKIVIEINEKRTMNSDLLIAFVAKLREHGFLVALDDVGEGHSNLNRIIYTRPDIIKIDRKTIRNLQENYYKNEIVRSISELASRIGAVVIAEGVEECQEIFACLSIGIHLYQGYYFSKAVDRKEFDTLEGNEITHRLTEEYKLRAERDIILRSRKGMSRKETLHRLLDVLSESREEDYESVMQSFLCYCEGVDCVYILDDTGKQITGTVFQGCVEFRSAYLFSPAKKKEYHIVKPYYYVVKQKKQDIYISDRYISAATGHFCETYSCIFQSKRGDERILCMDFSCHS